MEQITWSSTPLPLYPPFTLREHAILEREGTASFELGGTATSQKETIVLRYELLKEEDKYKMAVFKYEIGYEDIVDRHKVTDEEMMSALEHAKGFYDFELPNVLSTTLKLGKPRGIGTESYTPLWRVQEVSIKQTPKRY